MKTTTLIIILILFSVINSFSQEIKKEDYFIINKLLSVEEFKPNPFLKKNLPPICDNSTSIHFPAIYNQTGSICGQVAGVYYAYTYEQNCARNIYSHGNSNTYNPYFTWNFLNRGNKDRGMNFIHSWEIIKEHGNPTYNEFDYGTSVRRYMDGYENYYKAMQNRIENFYAIKINTEEGLNILKSWLYNHNGNSEKGGVANIYFSYSNYISLPNDSPEAGKYVITKFSKEIRHALTIVGYNDDIRYDFNEDGRYTINEDINSDGIIDLRDCEIGGIKIANTAGNEWANNGFSYVMYKTLAENSSEGFAWNNSAYIIQTKNNYTPKVTAKLSIAHACRDKIKFYFGYTNDTLKNEPDFTKEFPVFSFSGGYLNMAGTQDWFNPFLEIGLDLSQFYFQSEPGLPGKIFFYMVEKDASNTYEGAINHLEIIDHTQNKNYIIINDSIPIVNNDTSVYTTNINLNNPHKVKIKTYCLPITHPNEEFEKQLTVTGGVEPYSWEIVDNDYTESYKYQQFDNTLHEGISFNANFYGISEVELGFDFPYYGNKYNTVYVTTSGTILFEENYFIYPYLLLIENALKNNKVIAPFAMNSFTIDSYGNAFLSRYDDYIKINWIGRNVYVQSHFFEISCKLFKNGNIEFSYNFEDDGWSTWFSAISSGTGNYSISSISNNFIVPDSLTVCFSPPESYHHNITLSKDGLIWGKPQESSSIQKIKVKVTDYTGAFDIKEFNYITWPTETIELESNHNFNIFPNPFEDNFSIACDDFNNNNVQVSLYDLQGRKHSSKTIEEASNIISINTSVLKNLATGTYFVKLNYNNSFKVHIITKR
jgi:Secretion system C-terminal sorting domain